MAVEEFLPVAMIDEDTSVLLQAGVQVVVRSARTGGAVLQPTDAQGNPIQLVSIAPGIVQAFWVDGPDLVYLDAGSVLLPHPSVSRGNAKVAAEQAATRAEGAVAEATSASSAAEAAASAATSASGAAAGAQTAAETAAQAAIDAAAAASAGGSGLTVEQAARLANAVQANDLNKAAVGLDKVNNTADNEKDFAASQVKTGTLSKERASAQSSFTVTYNNGWPARPTARTDVSVWWVGGPDVRPTAALSGDLHLSDQE